MNGKEPEDMAVVAEVGTPRPGTTFIPTEEVVMGLAARLTELEERFERLVEAIDKSKRVRDI